MSAVRVARGVTGRAKIVKMTGHYHGHAEDCLLVQAGSAATTIGNPNSPGVTAGAVADTILCPFNDANAVAEALGRFPGQVAAVLLEPVAGNMGLVPPKPGYLEALRDMTAKAGAFLFFDEVMTGFRVARGGAQELLGVRPDITALGKIIGGGLPAAAYGASNEIMSFVSPAGPVYQAGTLSGNPLAMAAGLATLALLRDEPPYDRLEDLSARLEEGLCKAAVDTWGTPRRPTRRQHAHALLQSRACLELRRRQAQRYRVVRPLLLGDVGEGRVPALQPIRGGVRLGRAYNGGHRAHGRRRGRSCRSARRWPEPAARGRKPLTPALADVVRWKRRPRRIREYHNPLFDP